MKTIVKRFAGTLPVVVLAFALAGCGGGGGGGGGDGGGDGGGGSGTDRAVANAARCADLNGWRTQCGGTALPVVTSVNPLMTSTIKHAGYQALYDQVHGSASLHHDEPENNALFVNTSFDARIRAANGGVDLPNYNSYYECISSMAGQTAIAFLWNTVYHRLSMMRHRVTGVGYGDLVLARSEYPGVGLPATSPWGGDNAYATLDWVGYGTPAITLSYWPRSGTTGVMKSFSSDTENPDPVPAQNVVGPPIHVIFPTTSNLTSITVDFNQGGTHASVRTLVGGAKPGTIQGDTISTDTVADGYLDPGEVFIIPLAALNAITSYTYSISAMDATSAVFNVGPITFTTGN